MNTGIIERLVAEDMLYHYHMDTIYDNLGIPDKFEINLMEIVGKLMGIHSGNLPDPWVDAYMEYMGKGKGLNKKDRIYLAKECCQRLIELCV